MKRLILLASLILCLAPAIAGAVDDDIAKHKSCQMCGMDRAQWNFSRMLAELPDGTSAGFCSVRCLAVWMAVNIDAVPTVIRVADVNTTGLLDAESAVWVLGGKKPGVMTGRPKWALADQAAATAFIAGNGGEAATFQQALKAAYEDMYEDNTRIKERRAAKRKAAMEQKASQ